ncbi:hypothetical protein RhiirA4_545217 [Rhizophagus irregularis]|uniref:Uncharacterized protein n=1 Tax=Rhizophagus irregularis TaxID=588596 RepID=A0A2I1GRT8_9GLOM|nr:hypothetical protein RhiirA4_545217 [Rhizophagus irregularis]
MKPIEELDDEEIIKELKKWYSENALVCPICNKMILVKEAVERDKEFLGKICSSCFEIEQEEEPIAMQSRPLQT